MPITLVTGLPGHGKTLYTLSRWKPEAEKMGRPVFHNNIKGLNIQNWQPWEVKDWEKLPAGSLMVVDEAQFSFPVTGRGMTPEWVQKLATHRHLGLDIVVITQDPMLLDSFVRKLVDRHFHVVRKFGTKWATIHEFVNGVRENVGKNRKDSIRHEWRYPKEVYSWYQSSELHTVKTRIPARVWLFITVPFIFMAVAGFAWYRLTPENVAARVREHAGTADAYKAGGAQGAAGGKVERVAPMTVAEYAVAYQARVPGLPHTAPVYDQVTQPTQAPYPAACVASAKMCRCYTQQGTRLDTPEYLCRGIAEGGYFVAWGQPLSSGVPVQATPPSPSQQVAYASPGVSRIDGRMPYPANAQRTTVEDLSGHQTASASRQ